MLTARTVPAVALSAQVALLAVLATTAGLTGWGWGVGLASAVVVNVAVDRGLVRRGADALGPADAVTLTRAVLTCGVAALTTDSFLRPPAVASLLTLTVVALVLDAADGWVARRTRTASVFGARFDGEVDAFLLLVLSVYVAPALGAWVLAIGAARYVFAAAGGLMPWLREPLPFRYWRKVVTAVQGIVLTVAAADVVLRPVTEAALVVAMALLAESFGRDVGWLWRNRRVDSVPGIAWPRGRALTVTVDVLALLLVWFALVGPNRVEEMTPGAFARIPAEGLVLVGFAVVLPSRPRRILAAVAGIVAGLLAVLKILDLGFFAALDRPFNPVTDRGYFKPAVDFIADSIGSVGAIAAAAATAVLLMTVVCTPLAVVRLTDLVARQRRWSVRSLGVLVVVWAVAALSGIEVGGAHPLASTYSSRLAVGKVRAITADVRDLHRFDAASGVDRYRDRSSLLTGLRGKDVLVVFVESYGRAAVEGAPSSGRVRAVLDAGTRRLREAGYSSRSAYLTSPTFGALSWLAHATLQSGLWVGDQVRYDHLLSSTRMTLTQAFGRQGWRTVSFNPANREPWPEGKSFYRFDEVYDGDELGYDGPRFGFSLMPDQFALAAFQRLELAPRHRAPVMAEIDLASSHSPWAPLPHMVDWNRLGDGSVFERIHDRAQSAEELWRHPANVEAAYTRSVAYSLDAFVSFVEKYGDDDLVVILLGDHQPAPIISGHAASHDVPITFIAHDPAVLEQIAPWRWQPGLRPGSRAPVWPMDAFRNRLLTAFSPHQAAGSPAQSAPRP